MILDELLDEMLSHKDMVRDRLTHASLNPKSYSPSEVGRLAESHARISESISRVWALRRQQTLNLNELEIKLKEERKKK